MIASLPKVAKVWNALVTVGQSGDHVLVLPTSPEFATVVSTLALVVGFKLTVVVESEEGEHDLAANGIESESILLATGANPPASVTKIVLANEFNALSQDTWRTITAMGSFVLYDADINVAPDVQPFIRGAAFLTTGITNLKKQEPAALGNILKSGMECWAPLREWKNALPIPICSLKNSTQIGEAKSISNPVITYDYDDNVETSKVKPAALGLRLAPDATYVLVGCLEGLGRSLTAWMMERGAQSFTFISRSGDDQPEAARVVATIRKAGLDAQVYRADVANESEVIKVIESIKRPIRGVVHAAMVLKDMMFEGMSYDNFMAAVIPKVKGAKALGNALDKNGKASDLDFFVMTSSISATLGNPSQSNYCAANSFMDGLAYQRNLRGLSATALILPMVLDVGVVAENANIEISLTRQAMYGIDEREILRGFGTAMMQPSKPENATFGDAQIILGLEPAELAKAITSDRDDAYWLSDARFQQICRAVDDVVRSDGSGGSSDGDTNFAGQLKSAIAEGPNFVIQAIALHVMQRCARILMLVLEDFDFDGASIASHGLNSMIGAELRNWLFKEFNLDISFQHLLAANLTFKKLAVIIGETMNILLNAE